MRFFKYKNLNVAENNARIARYAELQKDEKRRIRKEWFLKKLALISFFIVSIPCIILGFVALKSIPVSENVFLAVLEYIGLGIAGIILVTGCVFIGGIVCWLIYPESTDQPLFKRNILSKACAHLREYYGLGEPYLVTKCYKSSDENFNDHDVCIFVEDKELRITANLQYGFLHGERDLGCYAFKPDEISLIQITEEKLSITELKCGETFFRLGRRAKSFIEKNFCAKVK